MDADTPMLAARMHEIAARCQPTDLVAVAAMTGVPLEELPVDLVTMQAVEATINSAAANVSSQLIADSDHPTVWLASLLKITAVDVARITIAAAAARRVALNHPLARIEPAAILDARTIYDLRIRDGAVECRWPAPLNGAVDAILLLDQRDPIASWAWVACREVRADHLVMSAIGGGSDGLNRSNGRFAAVFGTTTNSETAVAGWPGPAIVVLTRGGTFEIEARD